MNVEITIDLFYNSFPEVQLKDKRGPDFIQEISAWIIFFPLELQLHSACLLFQDIFSLLKRPDDKEKGRDTEKKIFYLLVLFLQLRPVHLKMGYVRTAAMMLKLLFLVFITGLLGQDLQRRAARVTLSHRGVDFKMNICVENLLKLQRLHKP